MIELLLFLIYLATLGLACFVAWRAGYRKAKEQEYTRGYAEGRKDEAFWGVVVK